MHVVGSGHRTRQCIRI